MPEVNSNPAVPLTVTSSRLIKLYVTPSTSEVNFVPLVIVTLVAVESVGVNTIEIVAEGAVLELGVYPSCFAIATNSFGLVQTLRTSHSPSYLP